MGCFCSADIDKSKHVDLLFRQNFQGKQGKLVHSGNRILRLDQPVKMHKF